jgi:hypothetical protein
VETSPLFPPSQNEFTERIRRQKPTGILTGKTLLAARQKCLIFFLDFLYIFIGEKNYPFLATFPTGKNRGKNSPASSCFDMRSSTPF